MVSFFDQLHRFIISKPILKKLTAFTRILLALGFIPSGLIKVFGLPFTSLGTENPVGYFFDAFHSTGFWYSFVGLAQVIAAILVLFPRTALIGALIFFPIIINIMVLTLSIGFMGTPIITVLMALACLYLLVWDYDKLKPLLYFESNKEVISLKRHAFWGAILGSVGILVYGLIVVLKVSIFWDQFGIVGFGFGFITGFFFGSIFSLHHSKMETKE